MMTYAGNHAGQRQSSFLSSYDIHSQYNTFLILCMFGSHFYIVVKQGK